MKKAAVAIILGVLVLASGRSAVGGADEPQSASPVYKTVGERKLTLAFDYPPGWKPSDKRPAIVFFFGGGWTGGTPAQFEPQAEHFAKRGVVCARADYRIRSKDGVTPDKCVDDALDATRWVRAHAAEFGIDPNRIVAAGGSAGGHLAACTYFIEGDKSSGEDKSVSPKPNAMILYNPVLDLVAVRAERAVRKGNFFANVDDATLKRISPGLFLRKEMPPTLIMDGTKDWLNPQIRAFVDKGKSMGAPVEGWYAEDQPHGFFNKPPWLDRTTMQADAFLCRIGYLSTNGVPSTAVTRPEDVYTAKIIKGEVFLSLNSAPDQLIGPFSKTSETNYLFKTKKEGSHSLIKSSEGRWYYSWDFVRMRAQPVEGTVLEQ